MLPCVGCTTSPIRGSDTVKAQSKMMDSERSEGVLNIATNTIVLPVMDMSISGAFRMQFMMMTVSGEELWLVLPE